jgi:nucleotide-binding universal stress UspA family protein
MWHRIGFVMREKPRILIALDGSESSFAAVRYTSQVLSKQSEVVLFHVEAEVPETIRDQNMDPLAISEEYPLGNWKGQQKKFIDEFMGIARGIFVDSVFSSKVVSSKTQTLTSGIARDIFRESQQGYSALVVGRTGIGKTDEITMGSVAAKLVEVTEHIPVVVVRDRHESKKVLVAFDGSLGSLKAVSCVGYLLDPLNCEVMLCHVLRPLGIHHLRTKELFIPKHEADWIASNKRKITPAINEAKRLLEQAGFSGKDISSEILTRQRSRAVAVVKAASDGGYKTIVLGRRGFTTVGEFKLGRVSRKILQYAFQPALWIVN